MRIYYWIRYWAALGRSCSWEVAGVIVQFHRAANREWGFWNAYSSHISAPWNRHLREDLE